MSARKCQAPGCNRTLITGRKYCYVHRSLGRGKHNSGDDEAMAELFVFFMIPFMLVGIGWVFGKVIGEPIFNWINIHKPFFFTILSIILVIITYLVYKWIKTPGDIPPSKPGYKPMKKWEMAAIVYLGKFFTTAMFLRVIYPRISMIIIVLSIIGIFGIPINSIIPKNKKTLVVTDQSLIGWHRIKKYDVQKWIRKKLRKKEIVKYHNKEYTKKYDQKRNKNIYYYKVALK